MNDFLNFIIDGRTGNDGSEKMYSRASPPTWDKSERADANLPSPTDDEWENEVTHDHPAKHLIDEAANLKFAI